MNGKHGVERERVYKDNLICNLETKLYETMVKTTFPVFPLWTAPDSLTMLRHIGVTLE